MLNRFPKIPEKIFEKILRIIEDYGLINKGDRVLLMCSGGPDSTFLFLLFLKLKQLYNFYFSVFHLDHKIRPDSNKERELLKRYCESFNIQLYSFEHDVLRISKENKRNLEDTARIIRYNTAYKVAKEYGFNKLSTAHNFNDFISTFFINLINKNHPINLFNLKPKSHWKDLPVIRPIMFIHKQDILKYLQKNNLEYVIDYTNFDTKLLRNKINKDLTNFVVDFFYNYNVDDLFKNIISFSEDYLQTMRSLIEVQYLKQKVYKLLPKVIQNNLLLKESLFFTLKNLFKNEIEKDNARIKDVRIKYQIIEDVLKKGKVNIKGKWVLKKIGNQFFLFFDKYKIDKIEIDLYENNRICIDDELFIKFKIIDILDYGEKSLKRIEDIFKNSIEKIRNERGYFIGVFDRKIKIRSRKNGDYFQPFGLEGKSKKLKNFLIDNKVEDFMKQRCLVFEDKYGIAVLWSYLCNLKRGRDMNFVKKAEGRFFVVEIEIN